MVRSLEIAQSLLEQTVPVLRCHPGLKRPWANGEGSWDVCDDPDELEGWLKSGDNLAILLGAGKSSPILGVGLDCYKNQAVMDRARELGISFKGATWSQRTGRGGYTLFYQLPDIGLDLKRDTAGCDGALDLLVSGYSLIAPSDTSKEPQGGGPYRWLTGHSPLDITLTELDAPPKDLLVWWQGLSAPELPRPMDSGKSAKLPDYLTGPIPEGQRDTTLTQVAGYWHRKLSDDAVVRHLIHQANSAQCQSPLERQEVDRIINSILRREGAGHFRGVQPAKLEAIR